MLGADDVHGESALLRHAGTALRHGDASSMISQLAECGDGRAEEGGCRDDNAPNRDRLELNDSDNDYHVPSSQAVASLWGDGIDDSGHEDDNDNHRRGEGGEHDDDDQNAADTVYCPPGWKRGRLQLPPPSASEAPLEDCRGGKRKGGVRAGGHEPRRHRRSRAADPVGSSFNEALIFWDKSVGASTGTGEGRGPIPAGDGSAAAAATDGRGGDCDDVQPEGGALCSISSRAVSAETSGGFCHASTREETDVGERKGWLPAAPSSDPPAFSFFESRKLRGELGRVHHCTLPEGGWQQQPSDRRRTRVKDDVPCPQSPTPVDKAQTGHQVVERAQTRNSRSSWCKKHAQSPLYGATAASSQQPKPRMAVTFLKKVRYAHLESAVAGTMPQEEMGCPIVYRGHREEELERRVALDARRKEKGVPLWFHPVRVSE